MAVTDKVINIDYFIMQPPRRDLPLANSLKFDTLKTGRTRKIEDQSDFNSDQFLMKSETGSEVKSEGKRPRNHRLVL